jgi:enoyl-CoA hydratase/carnithine racemase
MSEQKYKYIELTKKGKICILKLNRPEKKNAMSFELRAEIIDALHNLKEDNRIKCVIFYGGEEIFTAGFDRDEVQAVVQGTGDIKKFTESNDLFHHTILGFPKLLIAAINGYALAGGFDLAVLCHLRIASKSALFGHPEIGFGACPLFFPYMALVGRGKALELTLNTTTRDNFITAEEAYRLNLINKLVEPGEVLETAIAMAKEILKSPALAVTQLLMVSAALFDRIKAFDVEISTILSTTKMASNN